MYIVTQCNNSVNVSLIGCFPDYLHVSNLRIISSIYHTNHPRSPAFMLKTFSALHRNQELHVGFNSSTTLYKTLIKKLHR